MSDFVIIPGSLRKESLNRKLAHVWAEALKKNGSDSLIIAAEDLNVPLINEDDKEKKFPTSLKKISEAINSSLGVIVCTPEYNGGISPVIKNMIDWTSTLNPHPWKLKPVLLSGTTPGALAAVAALLHTRNPLDRLGAHVYPQSFGVAQGHNEIVGLHLNDLKKQASLEVLAKDFFVFATRLKTI